MMLNDDNSYVGTVGSGKSSNFNTYSLEAFPSSSCENDECCLVELDQKKTDGTDGTHGIISHVGSYSGSGLNENDGTGGITIDLSLALNPLLETVDDEQIEHLNFDQLDMPCYLIKDDWFYLGNKRKPGVWHCYEIPGTEKKPAAQYAVFICSPLHVRGVTVTENGSCFGRLLHFRDTFGRWRLWAMPMELLRGSCEELRGELLAAGVEIDTRHRNQLANYLQWMVPKAVWTAATHTGWTANGKTFVLHDKILGDERVHFQSESLVADGATRVGGDYQQWQQIVANYVDNPILITSLCVAFSGPLLAKLHKDSGGIHWVGDSSTGKTTAENRGSVVKRSGDF